MRTTAFSQSPLRAAQSAEGEDGKDKYIHTDVFVSGSTACLFSQAPSKRGPCRVSGEPAVGPQAPCWLPPSMLLGGVVMSSSLLQTQPCARAPKSPDQAHPASDAGSP